MGRHPGNGEAAGGVSPLQQIVAPAPVGIGHDGLAPDLVEGDVLGRMARRGGDGDGGEDVLGIGRRPLQRLHAAHGAAGDAEELVDLQMLDQELLGPHHIGDGDDGEAEAEGPARGGVCVPGPGGPQAAPQHIAADDEIALGVERPAGADHLLPPAGPAGHRILPDQELVAGQRMADQDGVGARRVQLAIGLIGDGKGAEFDAAIQRHAALLAEHHPVAGEGRLRVWQSLLQRGHRPSTRGVTALKIQGSRRFSAPADS